MDERSVTRSRIAVAITVLVIAGAFAWMLTEPQVGRILSTVGASVGTPGGGQDPGANGGGVDDAPAGGEPGGGTAGGDGQPDGAGIPLTSVTRPDLLVIKTGTLSLRVAAVEPALAAATSIVKSLGGYAAGSDRTGDPSEPHASVTFRIPAGSWEDAFSRLRDLAVQVLEEHSSTEDVTAQVVDLGARITNLQATERALQAIMDRAGVIEDVLAVQEELTNVRGQIEELGAQKAHLEEQAAYSTLQVSFSVRPPDPVKVEQAGFDPTGEVDRASASLIGILQDVATVGIWFGIVWLPILIALAVVGSMLYVVVRRLRRAVPGAGEPFEPTREAEG